MTTSKIPWTDCTWNIVTGCSRVSTGCQNCYAATMTKRLKAMGQVKYAAGFDTVVCHPDELNKPLRWKKPRRVFVNSMSDLFHEDVPFRFINLVFITMAYARQHTFQVLTKRPHRIAPFLEYAEREGYARTLPLDLCLPNVWLGTSIENQATANLRIPHLRRCPAAVRFLSLEPLLGSVEIPSDQCSSTGDGNRCTKRMGHRGHHYALRPTGGWGRKEEPRPMSIGWFIIGCESGPRRRPCELDWVRSLVQQGRDAGVPVFVKQVSINGRVSKDPAEWPEDLRVQQWPKGA
ncbi:hypothetical protein LCGC14_0643390 [marine sediment metagenome]|uniref:Phage Gp37Gp68 family protein n=1 Tax=marine sediment metagenome TaxID=412755 RepID=A0A0F9U6U8_9ZZZZ